MKIRTKTGPVSDLVDIRKRRDWSYVNRQLRALEPGKRVSVTCPFGVTVKALRSTLLTNGKRFHVGDWAMITKTEGNTVHCFLVMKDA